MNATGRRKPTPAPVAAIRLPPRRSAGRSPATAPRPAVPFVRESKGHPLARQTLDRIGYEAEQRTTGLIRPRETAPNQATRAHAEPPSPRAR
ncbi:hypothetical protein SRB5_10180 [Streptomyces sp. RB5]|uniref:Uncharacterized protein n=1 Tax=Streptomyces smaragdinus TaxID=2585196 RepID=A0A7K0CBT0_9ACTN|nr:hypothetical protein [Streptomyces smaragdinus]